MPTGGHGRRRRVSGRPPPAGRMQPSLWQVLAGEPPRPAHEPSRRYRSGPVPQRPHGRDASCPRRCGPALSDPQERSRPSQAEDSRRPGRCASLAAFSRSLASLACSFAWRSASRRCAAMRRSHSDRPPPPGTAVTLRSQMRTMTCMTITALHDQKKRLVFVSPLNVLADCVIAMNDLG